MEVVIVGGGQQGALAKVVAILESRGYNVTEESDIVARRNEQADALEEAVLSCRQEMIDVPACTLTAKEIPDWRGSGKRKMPRR